MTILFIFNIIILQVIDMSKKNNKLMNNGGWGLVEMLVLSGILLICLLIAAYLIYVLYSSF